MSRVGSLCRDPGTLVKRSKNQLCDYMTTEPAGLAGISILWCGAARRMNQARNRVAGNTLFMPIASPAHVIRPYCELYCHAVCTWKLWNLPLSWFVYERTRLNLINLRVLNRSRFALKNVGLCPFYCSTVKECNLFTRSFCSIRF